MSLFHCTQCHHEWEFTGDEWHCGWCGAVGMKIGKTWGDDFDIGILRQAINAKEI